jgi:phage shock protein A
MNDVSGKIKSFWERKEGTTGGIVIACLIAAGIIGGMAFLPAITAYIAAVLQNTLMIVINGGILLGIGLALWDKRTRLLISMAFKVAMRNLTGIFVTIDPIGILKEHLHKLDTDIQAVNEQLNKVKGVIVGLRRKVETYLAEYKQYMDLAKAAKAKNQAALAKSNSMFAERRKTASEKLAALHRKLEAIYRVLQKMYENSKIVRDQTGDEIEMKEAEWIAIRSASKAMKSAMSVINGNADERALYEQTLEYMATDVGNKIGEMERFLEVSQNVLAGIDLQQDVFSDKGLKELEEWGKTADSWILGDEKQKLLAAAADDNNVATIEGPPVDSSYAEMFKKL